MNARTGRPQNVKVLEDTGTDVNWITPELVKTLQVEVGAVSGAMDYADFGGQNFCPTGVITLSLTGTGPKAYLTDCYIAPMQSPIEGLVLGTGFIRTYGHAHVLFPERASPTSLLMVQDRTTVGHFGMQAKRERALKDRK